MKESIKTNNSFMNVFALTHSLTISHHREFKKNMFAYNDEIIN